MIEYKRHNSCFGSFTLFLLENLVCKSFFFFFFLVKIILFWMQQTFLVNLWQIWYIFGQNAHFSLYFMTWNVNIVFWRKSFYFKGKAKIYRRRNRDSLHIYWKLKRENHSLKKKGPTMQWNDLLGRTFLNAFIGHLGVCLQQHNGS